VITDPGDWPGVLRAAGDLRTDLQTLAGARASPLPQRREDGPVVIVGTLGRNALVDRLAREGKLDVRGLAGQWEGFVQQVVERPLPGVERALVIAGVDKRGTIFGAYDLSERAGVSPWSWWADVPVPLRPDLAVTPGRRAEKPAVKYRGVFLNDEDPALKGWVDATYGGFNHGFYTRLFELILRMKGDFLWPAMWGKAFYDDDPANALLADEYGVVIGTSHHEPLMRAHVEWERYGTGAWNYVTNPEELRDFWRTGMVRRGAGESLVTVGMRGDGDEPMTEGTATALLERIVRDQRKIIGEVTGKDPSKTPQVWALYKEVQAYYDKGMRVPDDVTLLFSDDNWGNIRRLPDPGVKRAGGYGVYYHFDYVGGPRNYKWLNTNQIERVWEQMRMAREAGADRLWIVNVGDLKPMEFPIDFFLDYAWNPEAWPLERLPDYGREWAAQQFGPAEAPEIAALLAGYTRFNARRKPELLAPDSYSLTDYRDAERVMAGWGDLERRAAAVASRLPRDQQDAYFQLVQHPILASANLSRLYVTVARNRLYAEQGRASTNRLTQEATGLFNADAALTRRYNEALAGGKWRHMMDQTHIGYTIWQQPPSNVMPEVRTVRPGLAPAMGVAVEGDPKTVAERAVLPALSPDGAASRWIAVFNRGRGSFRYAASAAEPWLKVTPAAGEVSEDARLEVSVDWAAAPQGRREVPITIRREGGETVTVVAVLEPAAMGRGYVEADGYVAIEAEHYARAEAPAPLAWKTIPGLGNTLSGVTALPTSGSGGEAYLEYDVVLARQGEFELQVRIAPSLDVRGTGGLRYAVSLDDGPRQVVNIAAAAGKADSSDPAWSKAVIENAWTSTVKVTAATAGPHRIRLWRIDPGVVFERLVLSRGPLPPTFLGPPESAKR
jgi:hypothetical protein